MEALRLGVVGCGGRIYGLIHGGLRAVTEVRVAAIVDPAEERVRSKLEEPDREARFYPSLEAMMAGGELDGLLIGTRCNLHAPYAIEAMRYGVPLFLEKPVAITMEQATALEEAAHRSRCPVEVSFPLRVSPLCERVREYVAGGRIGDPVHILADNYVPYGGVYWEELYRDYGITGGLFLQKATHDLDYMCFLMGKRIVRVAAMATAGRVFGGDRPEGLTCGVCAEAETCPESHLNRRRKGYGHHTNDHHCLFSRDCGTPETGTNEDASSLLLQFEDGSHGLYTQVFFAGNNAGRRGSVISGAKGTVEFDWYTGELRYSRRHDAFVDTVKASGGQSHFGGDMELAHDFIDLIRHGKKPRATVFDGIQSAYVCLAARESAASGEFVAVRQVRDC